jgi:VanZ family protein
LSLLQRIGLWAPVVAFMIGVYVLADPLPVAPPVTGGDKLLHAAAYGTFGVLCLRAFHGGLRRLRLRPTLLALLLTLGYGALDEVHQSRVPGRDPSLADWAADAAGASLAVPAMRLLAARRLGKRRGTEPGHGRGA